MPAYEFPPTPEQQAIISAASEPGPSIMVTAYAGCTKTSTMTMVAQTLPSQPALALAFNVKIKKELEKRFPSWFEVKTLNGLGHQAWGKAIGKRLEIDDRKIGKLVTQVMKANGYDAGEGGWDGIRKLVCAARHAGLVPSTHPHKGLLADTSESWAELNSDHMLMLPPPALDIARAVLIESVKLAFQGTIDFDDQIYMSALFGGVFPRFPLVMVDEAQDLSPLNHIQVRRVAAGRLIVVGDPKQAIYAFRGADAHSMTKLRQLRPEWIDLPLYQTFRCPKEVVRLAQDHAPGFNAAEVCAQGEILDWRMKTRERTWGVADLHEAIRPGWTSAIICRNNAPLLGMAFKLIRQGIGVMMLGRDIGKGLTTLAKKLGITPELPAEDCIGLIEAWMGSEVRVAQANGKDEKVSAVKDRGECLLAVIESGPAQTGAELYRQIDLLFGREMGQIILSTGHRAKGLEWNFVLHLDPWRVPSKFAKSQRDEGNLAPIQQEMNLRYVIHTRTKHTLAFANLEEFE